MGDAVGAAPYRDPKNDSQDGRETGDNREREREDRGGGRHS